jgi:hypothetical protein
MFGFDQPKDSLQLLASLAAASNDAIREARQKVANMELSLKKNAIHICG